MMVAHIVGTTNVNVIEVRMHAFHQVIVRVRTRDEAF